MQSGVGYLISTGVSLVLDLIALLIDLILLSDDETYDLFYTITAWVFLGFDIYVILWYFGQQFNMPVEYWQKQMEMLKSGIQNFRRNS